MRLLMSTQFPLSFYCVHFQDLGIYLIISSSMIITISFPHKIIFFPSRGISKLISKKIAKNYHQPIFMVENNPNENTIRIENINMQSCIRGYFSLTKENGA